MAKFYGAIGYSNTVESAPGVWSDSIVEKSYYGDIVRTIRTIQDIQSVNDELSVSNSISIVADAYASQNLFAIRYVRWMGTLWKVVDVEVQRPRLLLRLGGVYNGPTPAPVTP